MIVGLIVLSSCKENLKCDDEQVLETVKQIVFGDTKKYNEGIINDGGFFNLYPNDPERNNAINTPHERKYNVDEAKKELKSIENAKFVNILTTDINEELKSCGCEASIRLSHSIFPIANNGDKFYYNVKTDSTGKIIIEVLK